MPLTRGERLGGRKRGPGRQAHVAAARMADEILAGQSRLMAAASQLHDRAADTRMLGVQALVELADESAVLRQQCINLLCEAVRDRPSPFPEGQLEPGDAQLRVYRDDRALRQAIIGAIAARLRPDARVSWRGCDLDFTGAIFHEDHPAASYADEDAPVDDAAAADGQPPSPSFEAGPHARTAAKPGGETGRGKRHGSQRAKLFHQM